MAQPQAESSALGDSPGAQQQVSGRGGLVQPHQSSHDAGGNSHEGAVTPHGDESPSGGKQPLQAGYGPDEESEGQTSTAPHSLHAQEESQDHGADENSFSQPQVDIARESLSVTPTSAAQQDANEQAGERSHGDVHNGEKQSEAESHETSNSVVDAAVPEGPNRDDLVNLVQGTEQFIGMLQARDLS